MALIDKLHIDIVSAEEYIFSGDATQVIAMGQDGELGILPGHTALLTPLKPGMIRVFNKDAEDVFYVSSGTLEVQPHLVTVLADTVLRAADIDEVAALEAKRLAELTLKDRKDNVDYAVAMMELAQALAQLRALQQIKGK